MIEWLHQELKGQTVTLPSSSIMKLASKSIIVHPTVAAFLKSVKQMGPNSASPFPVMHEEFGFELDLNKLLEKQIEEINISTNGFRKEITENILEGVKGNQPFSLLHMFNESGLLLQYLILDIPFLLFKENYSHNRYLSTVCNHIFLASAP